MSETPVTIQPDLLCDACHRFMTTKNNGIWTCPECGLQATLNCQAEVIDDG